MLPIGYAVHSLALVADSFHMLNDVFSLLVGLWAVKVANQKASSNIYTYGWQRAETLGALINGVFLVALCLSIFLEAIQRLVEPQVVNNPKLVLIVGSFGLLSNLLGLLLFHEHSHGPGGHSHGGDEHAHAEEGHAHGLDFEDEHQAAIADESGNIADVLPQNNVGGWPQSNGMQKAKKSSTMVSDDTDTTAVPISPVSSRKNPNRHSQGLSRSRRDGSLDNIISHPSKMRQEIIASSHFDEESIEDSDDDAHEPTTPGKAVKPNESSTLLGHTNGSTASMGAIKTGKDAGKKSHSHDHSSASVHKAHNHRKPAEASGGHGGHGHGHSHGDLNMRGVFLHVMGDALGNIGVIASALFIWQTDFSWRYYLDPAISLIITIIILLSAIPLCKAASRILLQAVPAGLSVDLIREDIEALPGVISCHHVHVWQLSDTKLVASLHVQVGYEIKGEGSDRYMLLARQVRRCLHEYGIHSSTIQPEFTPAHEDGTIEAADGEQAGPSSPPAGLSANGKASASGSASGSVNNMCLLDCGDACGSKNQCCPAPTTSSPK